jgi:hypothetical protein
MINIPNHYYLVASTMILLAELQKVSGSPSMKPKEKNSGRKSKLRKKRNEKELAGWLRDIEEEGSFSGSGDTYFPSLRQYQNKAKILHSRSYQHQKL